MVKGPAVPEFEIVEKRSPLYLVRGIGRPVLLAVVLFFGMPVVGSLLTRLADSLPVSIGEGALGAIYAAGYWVGYLAPLMAGLTVLVGVSWTLLGGMGREYRATPGTLFVRPDSFHRMRTFDMDSVTGVEVSRGIAGRLVGGGSLLVTTKAENVRLKSLADPDTWADMLRRGV